MAPRRHSHLLASEACECDLFGKRVCVDALKLRISEWNDPGLPGRPLRPMATVLMREKGKDTEKKRRGGGRAKAQAALGEADVEAELRQGPQTLFLLRLHSFLMYQGSPQKRGARDLRFGVARARL